MNAAQALQSAISLDFVLPPELEASAPPEARGLTRDQVRLLVSYRSDNRVVHSQFRDISRFLEAGDVLVINTSGTLNAALNTSAPDGQALELHLSTHLPGGDWVIELRALGEKGTLPYFHAHAGETYRLPAQASATLKAPYPDEHLGRPRLWRAHLRLDGDVFDYLEQHGFPIRYSYVREPWPLRFYQNVYSTEPGSAEMPSAGRAFTTELITGLVAKGVQFAPLLLHTGVASLESHEPPYDEYFRLSAETARLINSARRARRRVIAIGTTAIRALETVSNRHAEVFPGEGWTDLVITPSRGIRAVDGLLTGFHEPRATHLAMLEALAGRKHLEITYAKALRERYLWHEFGDLHLILP